MGRIKDIDAELHELPDYEKGIQSERERIIKLLEDNFDGGLMFAEDWNNPSKEIAYSIFKGDIIALIKGEQV